MQHEKCGYQDLYEGLKSEHADLMRRLDGGGCTLAGSGRGDCEHYVGLPGISIPGQHDGPDDTVDAWGKPNGWCWSCWKSFQLDELKRQQWSRQELGKAIDDKIEAVGAQMRQFRDGGMPIELSASEALYGFMGWLTARTNPVTLGAKHDAAIAADLVNEFCITNQLREPATDFHKRLKHPEEHDER